MGFHLRHVERPYVAVRKDEVVSSTVTTVVDHAAIIGSRVVIPPKAGRTAGSTVVGHIISPSRKGLAGVPDGGSLAQFLDPGDVSEWSFKGTTLYVTEASAIDRAVLRGVQRESTLYVPVSRREG